MKGRYWIISNYDYDPSAAIAAIDSDDYVLCQQGAPDKVPFAHRDSRFAPTKHSGHNLSDYLRFLVEHYSDLPPEVGFIKGNVFPRHIDKQTFCDRIQHRGFVPLYSSGDTYAVTRRRLSPFGLLAQQVAPGIYLEAASGWYVKTRNTGQHFPTLESMFVRITGRKPPLYNPFVPGACWSSRGKISRGGRASCLRSFTLRPPTRIFRSKHSTSSAVCFTFSASPFADAAGANIAVRGRRSSRLGLLRR